MPATADRPISKHLRCDVLGVHVSAIDMDEAVRLSDRHIQSGGRGYVCVTGVHGIIEAQSDPDLRSILNGSLITTPDGMPTVWVGRAQGHKAMSRVYGPDYMLRMCELSVARGYRNFLYGGRPGVADALADALLQRFPGLQIVGTFTPPFGPLSPAEESVLFAQVEMAKPHILWVGISTPRQERFMAQYLDRLNVSLMVGVGAAFDIHTGRIADAPQWMKKSGLQWLHRLAQEPRRLAKRYLVSNTRFILGITRQFLRSRRESEY